MVMSKQEFIAKIKFLEYNNVNNVVYKLDNSNCVYIYRSNTITTIIHDISKYHTTYNSALERIINA